MTQRRLITAQSCLISPIKITKCEGFSPFRCPFSQCLDTCTHKAEFCIVRVIPFHHCLDIRGLLADKCLPCLRIVRVSECRIKTDHGSR